MNTIYADCPYCEEENRIELILGRPQSIELKERCSLCDNYFKVRVEIKVEITVSEIEG